MSQPKGAASSGIAEAPKRMGRRSAEESRKTRRSLIDAAILEFSEKGMNGARIDDIAERAGVTKGAVYTHFEGREDLLFKASRSAIRSLDLMQMANDATDLLAFMDETARRLIAPESRSARLLVSELYSSAMRSELIAELLAEWHVEFVGIIEKGFTPGPLSPQTIAVAMNFLHVACSHIDLYESMDVSSDDVLAAVNRMAASLLAET